VFILENWCNSHNTKKDKIWVVVYMGGKKPPPLGYHRIPLWGTHGVPPYGVVEYGGAEAESREKSSMSISKNKKLKSIV